VLLLSGLGLLSELLDTRRLTILEHLKGYPLHAQSFTFCEGMNAMVEKLPTV
jgi:L-rhamnose isomerase